MRDDLVTRGELYEWMRGLLMHFEMQHGYPSTYVVTMNGPEHGVVGDELGGILEEGIELLSALREELGIDEDDMEYEIEFEMELGEGDE